jgi:hypothetical protein
MVNMHLSRISVVLNIRFKPNQDFLYIMRSGDILCRLACALYQNVECHLLDKGLEFGLHKIVFFLELCKSLHIKRSLLFRIYDLLVWPEHDSHRKHALIVLRTVIALEKHARRSGWNGPPINLQTSASITLGVSSGRNSRQSGTSEMSFISKDPSSMNPVSPVGVPSIPPSIPQPTLPSNVPSMPPSISPSVLPVRRELSPILESPQIQLDSIPREEFKIDNIQHGNMPLNYTPAAMNLETPQDVGNSLRNGTPQQVRFESPRKTSVQSNVSASRLSYQSQLSQHSQQLKEIYEAVLDEQYYSDPSDDDESNLSSKLKGSLSLQRNIDTLDRKFDDDIEGDLPDHRKLLEDAIKQRIVSRTRSVYYFIEDEVKEDLILEDVYTKSIKCR